MNNILLTVGIPTFNGQEYLAHAIESVLSQLNENNLCSVEIVISDNASTDDTEQIVQRFVLEYPNTVRYHRNDDNLGFDRNVDNLFRIASGQYVEILGDDDYLANGALDLILNVIRNDAGYGVLLLNVGFLNLSSMSEIAANTFDSGREFSDKDEFFLWSKWRTAAISSIVIRKIDWLEIKLDQYMGNQWIHISALIEVMAINQKAYAFPDQMVTVRVGNVRWTNNGNQLKLGMIHLQVISKMLDLGYRRETFQSFVNDRFNNNLKDIILLAPVSFNERIKIGRLMSLYFESRFTFWALHVPMLLLFGYPLSMLKPIAFAIKRNLR